MKARGSVMRTLLKVLFTLVLIAILIPIGFIAFLEPNNYKSDIQKFVASKTGYDVTIQGDIQISWYPWLGLNAKDLTIKAKETDKDSLATVNQLNFKIPIEHLLKKEFTLDAISLEGVSLLLKTDKAGRLVWQSPSQPNNIPAQASPASQDQALSIAAPLALPIKTFKIINSTIIYQDLKSQTETRFNNVELLLTNLLPEADTPVRANFDFVHKDLKTDKIYQQGHNQINTTIQNKLTKPFLKEANIETQWKDLATNQSHDFKAVSDVTIQLGESIKINNLKATLDHSTATGQITVPMNQKPVLFDLKVDYLDLTGWIDTAQAAPQSPYVKTAYTPAAEAAFPNAQGKVSFQKLRYDKVTSEDVVLNINVKNNVLHLNPIVATIHKGLLKAEMSKTLTPNAPINMKGHIEHVDMLSLLSAYANMDQIQGQGDITFNLSYAENNKVGNADLIIKQGIIRGFDLDYYYEIIDNFVNRKEPPKQKHNGDTRFNKLTATLQLNNDILSNPDLVITADDHKVTGKGIFNLSRSSVDYDLMAIRLKNDNRFKKTLPLAIEIKGPVSRPKITPDIKKYAEMLMAQEGQRFIEKGLKKLLGNQDENKGDESTNGDSTDNGSIEDDITDGIRKIFKF